MTDEQTQALCELVTVLHYVTNKQCPERYDFVYWLERDYKLAFRQHSKFTQDDESPLFYVWVDASHETHAEKIRYIICGLLLGYLSW